MLKQVKEKVGLPESFGSLHGLRHSFASWLANSGQISMYELQKTNGRPRILIRLNSLDEKKEKS